MNNIEIDIKDQNQGLEEKISVPAANNARYYFLGGAILGASLIMAGAWIYTARLKTLPGQTAGAVSGATSAVNDAQLAQLEKEVLPGAGITLPIKWGDLGARLTQNGTIDLKKFEELYKGRGGLNPDEKKLLAGGGNGQIKITPENSGLWLNLLWALGLGNKNEILEKGPMSDKRYGGAENFASTGGWTLATGDAMRHFSRYRLVELTADQQALVEKVSKGIYRPCCGNSTYFPDCNHGMAMLGLLELMAAQGVNEDEMYRLALQVNSYWFPDTYLTIAKYLSSKGISFRDANPAELLGYNFSSGAGYKQIMSQVAPVAPQGGGGGCGA